MDLKISVVFLFILLLPFDVDASRFYVSKNKSLVSPGGVFELGFFSLGDRWYFGIWYKNIPKKTYVWVGNRDHPLHDSEGFLEIYNANLVLRDKSNNNSIIWGTEISNVRSPGLVAELLDNGNLVLRYSSNKDPGDYLWQSFDNPTNTLLPGMTLISSKVSNYASRRYLACWKAENNPAKGDFIFGLDGAKFPRLLILKGEEVTKVYRSGGWNGIEFVDVPVVFNSTAATNKDDATFVYQDSDIYSRITLTFKGVLQKLTWDQISKTWIVKWSAPFTSCDSYNRCGANCYCYTHSSGPMCKCIPGFEPETVENATRGCVRKTQLSCSKSHFSRLTKMKLPDTMDAKQYTQDGPKGCQDMCNKDCHCTAYTMILYQNGTSSSNCVTWTGDLIDLHNYAEAGQDLYIKRDGKKQNKSGLIIGLSLGATGAVIIIVVMLLVYLRKRKQKLATAMNIRESEVIFGEEETENPQLPPIDFGIISRATENFADANEIGHGGFGTVYKGRLPNGQEIAVKKLSEISRQGTVEFKTEVMLIANLQHINLVRLLGWSVHESERVLIYEYLENGSLENHLFGGGQNSSELSWQKRFEIIKGIAQGLAYMQEGSRVMIIHRDLKPANILLDRDMIPKISDFGLARIFSRSDTEANTTRPSGTYGYMSPEYAESGTYSTKSDIFSFGVMLLEIVSGKQNRTFSYSMCNTNLLSYMWTKWSDDDWEETVDQTVFESSSFQRQEVLKCVQIGLLCVQELAEDRPHMSSVLSMLVNETAEIPPPKVPGFFKADGQNEIPSSMSASTSTAIRYSASI